MAKGLDGNFLNFGIRTEDLELINTLCEQHSIDFNWLRDHILKKFHENKVEKTDLDEKDIQTIISAAIQQINDL